MFKHQTFIEKALSSNENLYNQPISISKQKPNNSTSRKKITDHTTLKIFKSIPTTYNPIAINTRIKPPLNYTHSFTPDPFERSTMRYLTHRSPIRNNSNPLRRNINCATITQQWLRPPTINPPANFNYERDYGVKSSTGFAASVGGGICINSGHTVPARRRIDRRLDGNYRVTIRVCSCGILLEMADFFGCFEVWWLFSVCGGWVISSGDKGFFIFVVESCVFFL